MNRGSDWTDIEPVPKAPPLPGPRFQGVRNAAYRIIGLPSRPSSPASIKINTQLPKSLDRLAQLASHNATVVHRTGLEINTLAINEKGSHALIGGKEIFKTVKVDRNTCVEDQNLRTAVRSNPTQASGKPRQVYSVDVADVAWAKGDCGDFIAAATTSGKIILYDLGHAGLQAALLHEHYRQVHRVTFNPHRGNLLLSGSQDGTVRLWDVRDVRTYASTIQSKRKFSGQSDGVRDVKWSPTEGVDFAFGTDSGWIQRWDIRNLKTPKIRIPAHQSTCTSLDWHPDGKHLISSGSDKMIRVWEFSSARRHKPAWELKTPYSISNARWRPACEILGGSRMCTQLATAYRDHPIVHIWDLRRPALPFRELMPHVSAPTDMLWHSQDLLWTVGRDGHFIQTDVHYTDKTIDKRNLQAIAISSNGRITSSVQQRHRSRSVSRSDHRTWLDDCADHTFLNPASNPIQKKSSRVLDLDMALHQKSVIPHQASFHGYLFDTTAFIFIAGQYSAALSLPISLDSLHIILDRCVHAASMTGHHRLAQTWKIVAFCFLRHVEKRLIVQDMAEQSTLLQEIVDRLLSTSSAVSPSSIRPVSSLARALASSTTTPLAKPTAADLDIDSSVQLPPSLTQQPPLVPLPEFSSSSLSEGHAKPFDIVGPWKSHLLDPEVAHRPALTKHDSDESFSFMIGSNSSLESSLPSDTPAEMVLEHPTRPSLQINSISPYDVVADSLPHPDHHLVQNLTLPPEQVPPPRVHDLTEISQSQLAIPTRHAILKAQTEQNPFHRLQRTAHVDVEQDEPFEIADMLQELLTYYTNSLPSAQTASQMLITLAALLPHRSIDGEQAERLVTAYLPLFSDELPTSFQHLFDAGINIFQAESILLAYYEQLCRHRLFSDAARLRQIAFPAFPSLYSDVLDTDLLRLQTNGLQHCEICLCMLSPFSQFGTELMALCLLCNHACHASCRSEIGVSSCPAEGCFCECLGWCMTSSVL